MVILLKNRNAGTQVIEFGTVTISIFHSVPVTGFGYVTGIPDIIVPFNGYFDPNTISMVVKVEQTGSAGKN